MNIVDIVILACFIPALIQGFIKGFVKQVVSLAVIFFTFFLSSKFSVPLGEYLTQYITVSPQAMKVICFVIILVVTGFVLTLVGRFITGTLRAISLGGVDKLLGAVLAVLEYAFIISIVIMFLAMLNDHLAIIKPSVLEDSSLWQPMHDFAYNLLFNKLFPAIQQ